MKNNKFYPIILAVVSLMIFSGMILRHEMHLKNSTSIFVELAPVDPRSMLQGDYMVLNYHLYFSPQSLIEDDPRFFNQTQVLTKVRLDAQGRVVETDLNGKIDTKEMGRSRLLILKNPRNHLEGLYPAANSFMFAEGLEPCYRHAKFAELKLRDSGEAMLVGLVDQQLQPLNCEQSYTWREGRQSF